MAQPNPVLAKVRAICLFLPDEGDADMGAAALPRRQQDLRRLLRELILESYELIAPKRSLAKLAGGSAELAEAKPPKKANAPKKRVKSTR